MAVYREAIQRAKLSAVGQGVTVQPTGRGGRSGVRRAVEAAVAVVLPGCGAVQGGGQRTAWEAREGWSEEHFRDEGLVQPEYHPTQPHGRPDCHARSEQALAEDRRALAERQRVGSLVRRLNGELACVCGRAWARASHHIHFLRQSKVDSHTAEKDHPCSELTVGRWRSLRAPGLGRAR